MPDWSRLFHEYGRATDAPAQLEALLRDDIVPDDPDTTDGLHATDGPYVYLTRALIGRQPTPATVATLRFLAAQTYRPDDDLMAPGTVLLAYQKVARQVLTGDIARQREMAAGRESPAVAGWLDAYLAAPRPVADWNDADRPGRVLLSAAAVDCHDLIPSLYPLVVPLMDDPWPRPTRDLAAIVARTLVRHPDLADRRASLLAAHVQAVAGAPPHHRASLVIGIGELGGDVRPWLDDPYLGVRVCAALRAAGTDADDLLVEVARSPRAFGEAFGTMHIGSLNDQVQELIAAVCARVPDFDRLWPAAIAALALRPAWTGPDERRSACAPYLRIGFPHGLPVPADATWGQRRFAQAAVERFELWTETWPGERPWTPLRRPNEHWPWIAALADAGLPVDRAAWRAVADHRDPPPHDYSTAHLQNVTVRDTVRRYPAMYIGCGRGDADFASQAVAVLARDMAGVGGRVVVDDEHAFTVELDLPPRPGWSTAAGFDAVPPARLTFFGMVAGFTGHILLRVRADGVEHHREYVDGLALGPAIEAGPADSTGMRATLRLDDAWLPRGARILLTGQVPGTDD